MANISKKVASAYFARQMPDFWLSQREVATLCPSCAEKMAALSIRKVRASVFFGDAVTNKTADKWQKLPEGWTQKSLEKFWKSLTSKAPKHTVTACIEHMKGKVSNPGAFCAAAKDRIEGDTSWRGER